MILIGNMKDDRTYIAIDLKSFYASVECVERNLDPLKTNLIVADTSRTDKTICLAVSPSLKSFGIPSRPRLFEVIQRVKKINDDRLKDAPMHKFTGNSVFYNELKSNPQLKLSYIAAVPRMALYIEYSTKIYETYLEFVSEKDIHVYSIDEVFIDVTEYLNYYNTDAHTLARSMIQAVLRKTGITATAGIGTNLYLAKVAMDIVAKHMPADKNGVRIAELNELSYRKTLWHHTPLTDFWRVGKGYAKRLHDLGLYTMGDIALCSKGNVDSKYNEDMLYKEFGINAELLIDHAWGYESCTMADIKKYKPNNNSMSIGQVLHKPYLYEAGLIIVKEMAEELALSLFAKKYVTQNVSLAIGYDRKDNEEYIDGNDSGIHGHIKLNKYSYSIKDITEAIVRIYQKKCNPVLSIRRITICAMDIIPVDKIPVQVVQTDLFSLNEEIEDLQMDEKDLKVQKAILKIKNKYGKNALVRARDKMSEATQIDRNKQIGGHKA
ncbi:MAG: DNA methylase [Bulleidia sp.]|nr:DNA methylase [Erysipelotrichaceae bacterium]MDY2781746.1 DNA methylase [Bulleidia sp.]